MVLWSPGWIVIDHTSAPGSGNARRCHAAPRLVLRKPPFVVPMKTMSGSSGCTVIAWISAPSGNPSVIASQLAASPGARRNTPPLPPSADFTAPAYTWNLSAMLASRAGGKLTGRIIRLSSPLSQSFAARYGAGKFSGEGDERQRKAGAAADRTGRA